MGTDCSLVFYRGTPLSSADLSQVFRRAAGAQLATTTLAIAHAENALLPPKRRGEQLWPVHALFAFERQGRYSVARGSADGTVQSGHDGSATDRSMSTIFKVVWKAVSKVQPNDQLIDQHPGLPLDWLIDVACEISRLRDRALWAMVSNQSTFGAYAMCEYGISREAHQFHGEDYESGPDRMLSQFAGIGVARVRDAFSEPGINPAETTSYVLLTQKGEFLDPPRRVYGAELANFFHLL
ncbi:MAG: hypothetical protein AB7O24_24065 [Kofleriaceae bacterium]